MLLGTAYGTLERSASGTVFRGRFRLGKTTYYVEDASDFLDNSKSSDVSVVYRAEDVVEDKKPHAFEPLTVPHSKDSLVFEKFTAGDPAKFAADGSNVCRVDLRVDNGVWNDYGQNVNKIRSALFQHIMSANEIFGDQFKTNGRPQVIGCPNLNAKVAVTQKVFLISS